MSKSVSKNPVGKAEHRTQARHNQALIGVVKAAAPEPGLPVGEIEDCLNRMDSLIDECASVMNAVRQRFDQVLTYSPEENDGKALACGKNSPLSSRINAQNERLHDHIAAMRALLDRCAL